MRHELPNDCNQNSAWKVRVPEFNKRLLQATVLERDGGNLWVSQYLDRFDAENPTARARMIRREASSREQILRRNAKRAIRRACNTYPTQTVVVRDARATMPTFYRVEALTEIAGALIAIVVSNGVLATYVVNSGSDLYASDPVGARLFAVLPVLATLGIKTFERFLPTDLAKSRYAVSFYVIGLVTFLIWTAAAAMTFAPSASTTSWLTSGVEWRWASIALIVAHILGDGAWGYVLFSGAEKLLLSNCKRVIFDNPNYAKAVGHAERAQAAHDECLQVIAEIDDYLAAVAAARKECQARAELELDRVNALWQAGQQAGLAYARARFLNANE